MSGIRIRSIPGCGWGVGRGGGVKVSFIFLYSYFSIFYFFIFIRLLVGLISEGVWADFNTVIVIYDAYRVL